MKKQGGSIAVVMLTSAAIVSLIMIAIGVLESQQEGGGTELANLVAKFLLFKIFQD